MLYFEFSWNIYIFKSNPRPDTGIKYIAAQAELHTATLSAAAPWLWLVTPDYIGEA